ncbi:terminase small subunit [Sutterella wadsworthensis]|uniref:terminase small subunit n=1 Tax=Sutterella wadsworthensis TaxID=40545 RepID=UPI00402A9D1B
MEERKLTPKQQVFVSEFLKCGNATEATRKAGYRCRSAHGFEVQGSALLRKPEVSRAIEAAQTKRNERLRLEEDYELRKGIELLDMCMKPKQVVDTFGKPVKDKETGCFVMAFDSRGANQALQTIAKLRGKFVAKIQVGLADDLDTQLGRIIDGDES